MRAIHSAARQQLMSADIQSRLASIAQLTFQTYALAVERAKALELPEPPLPASAFRPPPSVVPPSRMAPSFVTESEADDILRRILVARQAEHPDSRCGATPAAVPSAKEPAPCPKKVAAETVAKPAAEGGSPISVDNWAQRSKQIAQLMMANEAREMEARERLAQAKKRLKERHILPTTGLALPDLPKANPTASAKIEARIWKAAIESPLNADGLGKKPTLEELKEFGIVPSMTGSLSPALKDFEGTLGEIDYDDYDDDGEDEEDDNDEEDPDYVPSDDSEDEDDEDDDEDEDEDEPEQEEPKLEEQEDEEEEHEDATALLQELHQKRAELARMDAAIQRLYEEGEDYALEEEEKEEEEEEEETASSSAGRSGLNSIPALPPPPTNSILRGEPMADAAVVNGIARRGRVVGWEDQEVTIKEQAAKIRQLQSTNQTLVETVGKLARTNGELVGTNGKLVAKLLATDPDYVSIEIVSVFRLN